MYEKVKASLRNSKGEHLFSLNPDEIDYYSLLAERGIVVRSLQAKKGRRHIIFRLKEILPYIEPSKSKASATSLTRSDMEALLDLSQISLKKLERLIGWGLIPRGAAA